ncbi:DUF6351 family protein [Nocardioides mangrovi]|uniref:DUF6351 family protein n=1 Tax=Nocardioides mangrovi TaxID=2874580 RepID=A0ABS7UBJ1_9ACTN|nr:DUF6351 family protein [Nocardioides mangrovi]MBZ5738369.1 DUF6351 family protein [Nocardioides mangrovi]
MRVRLLLLLALLTPLLPVLTVLPSGSSAAAPRPRLVVEVLSTRADLVSAGDVLVAVRIPAGVRPGWVRVTAGGRDVTRRFAVRDDGRYLGLVRGLPLGRTVLRASAPGARAGSITVTDHPAGGPLFSGPQTRHYVCQDGATDARCDEPATYDLLYRSTNPLQADLQPYDPADPPADVATTTTDQGVEVPFIVRREQGFLDRDRYTILTLWQPGQRWRPWSPQEQWNHKLLVTHGGGCGASYTPGEPPLADYSGTLDGVPATTPSYVTALGLGFAVLSTALDNTGHNCSVAMNAESVLMAKERLVERYGELRYTIGTGCSGGSIAQHTVANAYPGIYQGLITSCSYPDTFTAGAQFADYHLLRLYFEDPSRWGTGVVWSPTQMAQVEGHLSHLNAVVADEGLFKAALNPENACPGTSDPVAGDPSTRYDSETNPTGVRCSVLDLLVNQLGRRPASVWTSQEKAAGHGFGGLPFSNDGVLYGLSALEDGTITPGQFIDLNVKIGGLDVDSQPIEQRIEGDPAAIANAYRTGLIDEANHLDEVAMINHGGPDPGLAHDYAHAFWTEERLMADQGDTDNRVMWFGPTPLIGDVSWATEALTKMDEWLSAVEADDSSAPLATKVATDRPDDVTDRCVVDRLARACDVEQLQVLQTRLSTPRQEAGGPLANDIVACALAPLDRADFGFMVVPFTDEEWATLEQTFRHGVCDWSERGRGQGPAETWLRYDARGGGVAYGGRPLPAVPAHSGGGLTGPAWQVMLRR